MFKVVVDKAQNMTADSRDANVPTQQARRSLKGL